MTWSCDPNLTVIIAQITISSCCWILHMFVMYWNEVAFLFAAIKIMKLFIMIIRIQRSVTLKINYYYSGENVLQLTQKKKKTTKHFAGKWCKYLIRTLQTIVSFCIAFKCKLWANAWGTMVSEMKNMSWNASMQWICWVNIEIVNAFAMRQVFRLHFSLCCITICTSREMDDAQRVS